MYKQIPEHSSGSVREAEFQQHHWKIWVKGRIVSVPFVETGFDVFNPVAEAVPLGSIQHEQSLTVLGKELLVNQTVEVATELCGNSVP